MVSFEDHIAYAEPAIQPVLRELRRRIKGLDGQGRKINERVTRQQRIAYSVNRIFAEVKVQKNRVLIRFFGMGVSDPQNLVSNISATHGWQHDKQIAVDSLNMIDYAMRFVDASYRSHIATMPVR